MANVERYYRDTQIEGSDRTLEVAKLTDGRIRVQLGKHWATGDDDRFIKLARTCSRMGERKLIQRIAELL